MKVLIWQQASHLPLSCKALKNTKVAIIEIDEGSIPRVLKEVTPSMMIFTNFFRDQMDRFGEIDIMVNNIAKSISNKGIKLLLNADDPFVSRLKNS